MVANPIDWDSYAEDNNPTASEELVTLGPFTLTSKIDLGMIIAAAAFGFTIFYNFYTTSKAQENLRREMEDRQKEMKQRAVEQQQSIDAQQKQIEANRERLENDRRFNEAGFWLTLRNQITHYDDIEFNFLRGGKWDEYGSAVTVEYKQRISPWRGGEFLRNIEEGR